MLTNHTASKCFASRSFQSARAMSGLAAVALLLLFANIVSAQSSPLTIKPSAGHVSVGATGPQYPLDVTGTVNSSSFRGDGSQLTGLPTGGGGSGGYGSRGQA